MTDVPAVVAATFDGRPIAAHRGPKLVQEMLGDDVSIAFIRDAMVLTAELVTAATTTESCTFNASFDGIRLRVEIADLTPDPTPSAPAAEPRVHAADDLPRRADPIAGHPAASAFGTRPIVWFELNQQAHRWSTEPDVWR